MARPISDGLNYFPLDVTMFSNRKIKSLRAFYGMSGVILYLYLLCEIYRNGYMTKLDDDLVECAAADLGMSIDEVMRIIGKMCDKELFSKRLYESYGLLTSYGIQSRYQEAKRGTKRNVSVKAELWLLPKSDTLSMIVIEGERNEMTSVQSYSENNPSFSENNPSFSEKNPDYSEKNYTKERREKQSKSEETKTEESTAEQSKSEKTKPQESTAEQSKSEKTKTEESTAEQSKSEKTKTEESTAEQTGLRSAAAAANNSFGFSEYGDYASDVSENIPMPTKPPSDMSTDISLPTAPPFISEDVSACADTNGFSGNDAPPPTEPLSDRSDVSACLDANGYSGAVPVYPPYNAETAFTGRATLTPADERDALVAEYGEQIVSRYEQKFRTWSGKYSAVHVRMYPTIKKWLAQDAPFPTEPPDSHPCNLSSVDVGDWLTHMKSQYGSDT